MNSGGRSFRPATLTVVAVLAIVVLFVFSSLNLKNIDYGYRIQELLQRQTALAEQIDRLRAERSQLLNLQRIESIAVQQLGFAYPEPGQVIGLHLEPRHDH